MYNKVARVVLSVCGVLGIIVGLTKHQYREAIWAFNSTCFMILHYSHLIDEENRYRV